MVYAECGPSKKCAVADLGDISALRGSRPNWLTVFVLLLVTWTVGT